MTSEQKEEKKDPASKCEKYKEEAEEYLDGWKRAKADLANYKKEEAKRFMEMVKFASEDLIREMIVILDSFDLGLAALEKDGKAEKGLYLIRTQLEDALRKRGLERVIISVGQPFDAALQEAIAEVESDKSSGIVIEEVERGYLLNGKLIRPARVKVSK
ncbi:MAG TPA: nucleotide exchange factor GrpE [Candidatus Wolfebacteria bacterium]|nr:nucleotide exchange factor GrpE [Candidatus Wolfebacteria bacterium]